MDCETMRETYDPSGENSKAVHEHLLRCQACQKYADGIGQLRSLLASYPPVTVPPDFDLRLQRRLEQVRKNPLQWWRFSLPGYALAVAAMALVAISALVVMNRSDDFLSPASSPPVAKVKAPSAGASESAKEPENADLLEPGAEISVAAIDNPARADVLEMPGSQVDFRAQGVATGRVGGATFEPPQVILRIRDDMNQQERLVTIPSVVFGAEPVFASTRSTPTDMDNVY